MNALKPAPSPASRLHLLFRLTGWSLLLLTIVPVFAQTFPSTPYSFTTLAGAASIGSLDGTVTDARFNAPSGITIDSAGNLYIADTANHTIRKITPAGIVTTLAGKAGYSLTSDQTAVSGDGTGSGARFNNPAGLTVDTAGNLYVVGGTDAAVRKVTAAGVVTTLASGVLINPFFNGAQGIVLDPAGNLYVSDTFSQAIRKITPSGTVTTLAGGSLGSADGTGSGAAFSNPRSIVRDTAGNFFVADSGNSTIRKITPDGVVTTFAGSAGVRGAADGINSVATFNSPCGLAFDATGTLYVADSWNATIRKITPSGVVSTLAGQAGQVGHTDGATGVSLFYLPVALTVDQTGNIFVADAQDHTIRKITPAGLVTTISGLSHFLSAGDADGTTAARFRAPQGLAVGSTGEIYVADTGNHTLRKISATGAVSTLAGLAGTAGYLEGTGAAARFNTPVDVTMDTNGNVFVADAGNAVIRKVTATGVVSTVAGKPGQFGSTDGPAGTALLGNITGVAVDASGNLYVSETRRLRKISVDGQVTTLPDFSQPHTYLVDVVVDATGNVYACDATYEDVAKITPSGTITRILPHNFIPAGIAVDGAGNLFVTGASQNWVWKLTPDGVFSIIGGRMSEVGNTDGVGPDARFQTPSGIAVDSSGHIYVACSGRDANTIRKGQLAGAPAITTQPTSQTISAGAAVQFSVTANGVPAPKYQWYFNDGPFAGATSATLSFPNARSTDAGDYSVVITNELGSVTSNKAKLTVSAATTPTPTPGSGSGSSGGGGSLSSSFALVLLTLVAMRSSLSKK